MNAIVPSSQIDTIKANYARIRRDLYVLRPAADSHVQAWRRMQDEDQRVIAGWPKRPRKILLAVCRATKVRPKEIISHSRVARLVRARQHVMWLLRQETTLSSPQIAALLGNRDHTTILHGANRHAERLNREARQ